MPRRREPGDAAADDDHLVIRHMRDRTWRAGPEPWFDAAVSRTGKPAIRLVESVQRAFAVVDALAEADDDLGTNELARLTGINASSVSRLLATLVDGRIVEHDPETGRYRLGPRLLQLGGVVLDRLDLRRLAKPRLRELVRATGETATLSVAGERDAVTVDFLQTRSSVQSIAHVGRQSVAHATATGKVLLAFGGRALPPGPLKAYTEHTIVDRAALVVELDRVRAQGFAENVRERDGDLHAVAAPVLGSRGELAAIMGVQGPSWRFGRDAMSTAIDHLRRCAAELSADLGGRPAAHDQG
jgi:IclR family acetate operon transcriptional repressor